MKTFYQYWVSRYCSRDPFSPFSCCRQVSTAETLINQASAPNSKKGYPFLDILFLNYESARRDSNPRPQPWQGCTPPTEPLAHYLSTYPQNHTLKIYSSVSQLSIRDIHRPAVYFMTLASPMSQSCQVRSYRCKHLPSRPFQSCAAP